MGRKPCLIVNDGPVSDMECVIGVIKSMDAGDLTCECNVECEVTDFKVATSLADWPSKQYEEDHQYRWNFLKSH